MMRELFRLVGVFLGKLNHFIELILATETVIGFWSQFWNQLVQYVPLSGLIYVPGVILVVTDGIGVELKETVVGGFDVGPDIGLFPVIGLF